MTILKRFAIVPIFLTAAACGQGETESLSTQRSFAEDLELAIGSSKAQQGVSLLELGVDSAAAALTEEPVESPPARTASAPSSPASTVSRTSSSGTTTARAPVARTETVKHTKRDAAIGAGAGAVIGAVAGGRNNRVEGAVVGAVVGGVIGGVIGNNVDKSTRVVYELN